MLNSMTAFASTTLQAEWGVATWELRSVNHRYLDINFKLPEGFHAAEIKWRKLVQSFLQRGKVECQLSFFPSVAFLPKLQVNHGLVTQLVDKVAELRSDIPGIVEDFAPLELLRWPGVVQSDRPDVSMIIPAFSALLETGLKELVCMRQREGAELFSILDKKLAQLLERVQSAKPQVPISFRRQREKLEARLMELEANHNERLEQEMVLFATKWDVAEELDRLQCHYQEVRQCIQGQAPSGRRLDFLMQEMNREANTLAAKSQDPVLSKIAVDLKVLIEQMREQIQNVE